MRDGRQRVPIVVVKVSENPSEPGRSETANHVRVVVNVRVVVIVDELVAERLAEDHPRDRDQNDADREFQN